MSRKPFMLLLAAIALTFGFTAVLEGADPTGAGNTPDVWAGGAGKLNLESKGHAVLAAKGDSVILICNVDKTKIKIDGKGKVIPLPKDNALLILNLKGEVKLKGLHIKVSYQGPAVVLKAEGKGALWLKGSGLLKLEGKPPVAWPPMKFKKFTF